MFVVGKILKPHGIKGSVKAEVITSFPEHFLELKTVFIEQENQKQAYSIEEARLSDRFVFIKFSEINNVEQAEALRNKYIFITADQLTPLHEDEYYTHDLIGLTVVDEKGRMLGQISDVWSYLANDVYVLQTPDKKEKLIPAIKSVVKAVNLKERTMTVHVLEGMLDE
jgi:16S rRNA processing protein RimM